MKISIFGLGYVGCVSLACLSKNGHQVIGVDINKSKVESINKGVSPVVEEGVSEIISEQIKKGRINATQDTKAAIQNSDVSLICVGTPSTANGHLNLDAIFNVAKEIGQCLKNKSSFHTIAIRSTVLPGTNEKVTELVQKMSKKRPNESFAIVSNPEFLREGTAIKDFHNPPYTLIGSSSKEANRSMEKIYAEIDQDIIFTEIRIAEILKYVNNAFHATKIIFANEVGNICKKMSIDSHELMRIFCLDKKLNISPYYLKPGFAYGGSCLPKDLKALLTIGHDNYLDTPLLESINRSNENQKKIVYDQIIAMNKLNIGFLGLSFKAGTDDLRNSPIIDIIERLLGKGFNINIYDKNVHFSKLMGANKEYILKKIPYISRFVTDDPKKVIDHSEVLVVVHNSQEFISLLEKVPESCIVLDLANIKFLNRKILKNYIGVAW